jgi:hypothetical protein
MRLRRASPLILLVLAGLMLVVAVTTAHGARCPRACRVLQPKQQTWVCPMIPGGGVVVGRGACFVLAWPEPTL